MAPFVPLPPLEGFQEDVKTQALQVLNGTAGANRGVLTLPTGAGKTRTAVECLVEWRLAGETRRIILWIAQSDELCEQAVQAFKEVWTDLGHRKEQIRQNLVIARFWGPGRSTPVDPDIVVASIQKLHAVVQREGSDEQEELAALCERLGAVVVDEAHRVSAQSYDDVLRFMRIDLGRRESSIPIIGLTATPFRSNDEETRGLADRFHGNLIAPRSLGALDDTVMALRRMEVLSEPEHEVIDYGGREFDLEHDPRFVEPSDSFGDLHPEFLLELGQDEHRNRALLDRLLELPPDTPTLFFGCTVQHAEAMAVLLRRAGRSAEAVTSGTRSAIRRALIEQFRERRLSVLCNFGVLTTGFDAPKVEALVVGRPTTSRVLYEQMIGRGMRGPKFGGTPTCTVIDVHDNIRFRGRLAYTMYSDYWTSSCGG
ncbi:DEAD/DEAH box helicase [Actinomadura gamaensis]|uniref:DEAD/DEAH box helicase n=1 Tax=Actinomadura gamaensis TaxID=1763541 RepID=A0ABV9UCG8_9ACTN